MKTEQCLMCIVCFVLGWFVHNVVGKCGFGTEHLKNEPPGGFDGCGGKWSYRPNPVTKEMRWVCE